MTSKLIAHPAQIIERVLPWVFLGILLFFTYVKFFAHPYVGFRWGSNGDINFVFSPTDDQQALKVGDRLLQVGPLKWAEFKTNLSLPLIDNVRPGDVIPIRVERAGQELIIPWIIPGPTPDEVSNLFWSEGWLSFVFWILGTIALFNIRPKNDRWALLIAFNFLTSVWLTAGSNISAYHLWGSAIVLRVFVWLCVPVYLHLHWVFPKPLGKLPVALIWIGYVLAALLATAEVFQKLPELSFYIGFLIAVLGSLIFLALHLIRQPDTRKAFRILFLVVVLSFAPSLIIGILKGFLSLPDGFGGLGLVSLPLLPLSYFYVVQRYQLGNLEVRFNRILTVYVYTILMVLVSLPLIALLNLRATEPGAAILNGTLVLVLAILVTIFSYRQVEGLIERIVLGISLPPRDLLELYSERITTSSSLPGLLQILEEDILPRLHIRQFAFIQVEKRELQVLQMTGVSGGDLPFKNLLTFSAQSNGRYRPLEASDVSESFVWVRLVLELKIENDLIGLWLMGRRDPDDFYAQAEISLLQSLANQTAIAFSNIQQTQRVLVMYQQDIGQREQERMRLALDLHDSVLNQLAALQMQLDDSAITPQFQKAYDELTGRLREIVHDLRPAMLNYGLKPAFDELVEGLLERDQNGLQVILALQPDDNRYPAQVEQHLFRIVQEACENALRHGHARRITITGALKTEEINLSIVDNGTGFDAVKGFELAGLLANKHFGLAGILERARLVGGDVKIDSALTLGTSLSFRWASIKN